MPKDDLSNTQKPLLEDPINVITDEASIDQEPEELEAARIIQGFTPQVRLRGSPQVIGHLGHGSGMIAYDNAAVFASGYAHQCRFCAHWDHAAAQAHFESLKQTQDGLLVLNKTRHLIGALKSLTDPTEVPNDALLAQFGVCRPQTEIHQKFVPGDPMLTHFAGGCPTTACEDGTTPKDMYKPKYVEQKNAAAGYDAILNTAKVHSRAQFVRGRRVKIPLGRIRTIETKKNGETKKKESPKCFPKPL